MQLRKVTTLGFALCAIAAANAAKPTLKVSGPGQYAPVLAYAPIDDEGNIIGPWRTPALEDFSPNIHVFDIYEANPTGAGAPDEYRSPNWGENANRYYFGAGYKNAFCINDFTVVTGYNGASMKRANFAFANTGASEAVFVQIKVYDTFTNSAAPPGANGFLSGYVASLGTKAVDTVGYYFASLTLSGIDAWQAPADGSGAYEIKLLKQLSPETQSTEAQPMLWIIKPNQFTTGSQGPNQWDDDVPTQAFNAHQENEFYSYAISDPFPAANTTLEPMGAMMAFYTDTPANVCPGTIATIVGTELSGDINSVCASDNDRYSAFADEFSLVCTMQATATMPNRNPGTVVVRTETSVLRLGIQEQLELFNNNTNLWQNVNGRVATATDSTVTVTRTVNANHYVNSGSGAISARITFAPINDEDPAQDGYEHLLDAITFSAY